MGHDQMGERWATTLVYIRLPHLKLQIAVTLLKDEMTQGRLSVAKGSILLFVNFFSNIG